MPDQICRLITGITEFPSGGFVYSQDFNGVRYDFPDIGLNLMQQAQEVWKFRKANKTTRASYQESIDDISIYTCARLGCNSRWCSDGSIPIMVVTGRGCSSCGASV